MAATAYLARVYFQKGDYMNASISANKVINSGNYSLNTNPADVFQNSGDYGTSECIFQLVNIETDQSNSIAYNYAPSDDSSPLFQGSAPFDTLYPDEDTDYMFFTGLRDHIYYRGEMGLRNR